MPFHGNERRASGPRPARHGLIKAGEGTHEFWKKEEAMQGVTRHRWVFQILNLSQARCWNGSLLQRADTAIQTVIIKKHTTVFSSALKVTDIKDICVSFSSDSVTNEACPPSTPCLVCEQVCVWDAALILEANPMNPIPIMQCCPY